MAGSSKSPGVSISGETYAKLKAYCELHGISMRQFVELRVDEFLSSQPENLLDEPVQVATQELP
jgi:hypothetical protein